MVGLIKIGTPRLIEFGGLHTHWIKFDGPLLVGTPIFD